MKIEKESRRCDALRWGLNQLDERITYVEGFARADIEHHQMETKIKALEEENTKLLTQLYQMEVNFNTKKSLLEKKYHEFSSRQADEFQQKMKNIEDSFLKQKTESEKKIEMENAQMNKKFQTQIRTLDHALVCLEPKMQSLQDGYRIRKEMMIEEIKTLERDLFEERRREKEFQTNQIKELEMRVGVEWNGKVAPMWRHLDDAFSKRFRKEKKSLHSDMMAVNMIDLLKRDLTKLEDVADKLRKQISEKENSLIEEDTEDVLSEGNQQTSPSRSITPERAPFT